MITYNSRRVSLREADPLGDNSSQCLWAGMHPRANKIQLMET